MWGATYVKRKFHAQFLGGCGRVNRLHLPGAMSMNISAHMLCPSCRGSRMVLGQPKSTGILDARDGLFRPMGKLMFLGFQTFDVACIECGYVGTCLSEEERAGLEKKLGEA
jgi:hypothetical protein